MSLIIELNQVSISFGGQSVLKGLDLALPEGHSYALIGPSGCGKSTILNLVNGLLKPDSGQVQVFGQAIDYQNISRFRRKIGYAVQGLGLFPHLTVSENISLLAQLEHWDAKRIAQRADHLLQLVELDLTLKNRYPHQLSGGQQQRVGLARAMFLNPPLLLLDEPFSAIDVITRASIHQALLNLLNAEPVSVLLVTHDIREARKIADQILVVEQGQIIQSACYEDLALNPQSEFIEKIINL